MFLSEMISDIKTKDAGQPEGKALRLSVWLLLVYHRIIPLRFQLFPNELRNTPMKCRKLFLCKLIWLLSLAIRFIYFAEL